MDALAAHGKRFASVSYTHLDVYKRQQAAPAQWNLHNHPFALSAVICDAQRNAWSGSTTCEELAAHYLAAGATPSPTMTLEFAAPTAFKSREMQMPMPLPGLVFGSPVSYTHLDVYKRQVQYTCQSNPDSL